LNAPYEFQGEEREKSGKKKVSSTTKRPIIFSTPFPTRRRRHNDSNDMKTKEFLVVRGHRKASLEECRRLSNGGACMH